MRTTLRKAPESVGAACATRMSRRIISIVYRERVHHGVKPYRFQLLTIREVSHVAEVDADAPDAEDGGGHRYRRLAPDGQQGEGGHGQASQRDGYGAKWPVHVNKLFTAFEIPHPGCLVEDYQGKAGYQPKEPGKREPLRADEDDSSA